uniref:Tetraspanin n=1 Tax=Ciona savignyi TaxID=51511 RepID=H2ZJS8_CIOSA
MARTMKTTPAVTCMKTLLVIFTLIFLVIGIALVVAGTYSKISLTSYNLLSTTNFSSVPYVMIGVGAFIFVVGVAGCCAATKGNTCLLRTYAVCLGVIFLAELIGALAVIISRNKINTGFEQGMKNAMTKYKTDNAYKSAVDNAQNTLMCCGSTNYTDYWTVAKWNINTIPLSCCINKTWGKQNEVETKLEIVQIPSQNALDYVYKLGCPQLVFGVVDKNFGIVIGSMFGIAFFQLIGIILSCCLATSINANKYELV